jgi:hypothetical protein
LDEEGEAEEGVRRVGEGVKIGHSINKQQPGGDSERIGFKNAWVTEGSGGSRGPFAIRLRSICDWIEEKGMIQIIHNFN